MSSTAIVKKIERLTPEQEASLPLFREEWFRVGTCTDPADRPVAESAITKMYEAVGKQPPRFIWCDSPMTAQLAMHLLSIPQRSPDGASLQDSLWASLGASLGA